MITILGEPFNIRMKDGKTYKHVVYECECGKREIAQLCNAKRGVSCGCLNKRSRKHLMTKTNIYTRWSSMMRRCHSPNTKRYKDYGARGITVCEAWHTFENFFNDMGHAENGLTLDRIDNNKGYCKENCKWSNSKEQARNRRNTRFLTINGITKSISEWSEESGAGRYQTISCRYVSGWSHEECVFGKIE
jgi:hypothetical protein